MQYIHYKHAMPARALCSTLAMSIARLIFNTGLGFSDPATVLRVGRHQNMHAILAALEPHVNDVRNCSSARRCG